MFIVWLQRPAYTVVPPSELNFSPWRDVRVHLTAFHDRQCRYTVFNNSFLAACEKSHNSALMRAEELHVEWIFSNIIIIIIIVITVTATSWWEELSFRGEISVSELFIAITEWLYLRKSTTGDAYSVNVHTILFSNIPVYPKNNEKQNNCNEESNEMDLHVW